MGTPHFSLGIPISVWGSPNQNGDPRTEMGMRITKNPQTDLGIPEPKWVSIHPHTNTRIPESVWGLFSHYPELGLGFVPIWDFRVSSPNWKGIQNGDPILERGSPYRNGDSPNWFPNRGVPESVWGSFQFGDQIILFASSSCPIHKTCSLLS